MCGDGAESVRTDAVGRRTELRRSFKAPATLPWSSMHRLSITG